MPAKPELYFTADMALLEATSDWREQTGWQQSKPAKSVSAYLSPTSYQWINHAIRTSRLPVDMQLETLSPTAQKGTWQARLEETGRASYRLILLEPAEETLCITNAEGEDITRESLLHENRLLRANLIKVQAQAVDLDLLNCAMHQLCTHATTMINATEMMARQADADELESFIKASEVAAHGMIDLLADLGDLYHPATPRLQDPDAPLLLSDFLDALWHRHGGAPQNPLLLRPATDMRDTPLPGTDSRLLRCLNHVLDSARELAGPGRLTLDLVQGMDGLVIRLWAENGSLAKLVRTGMPAGPETGVTQMQKPAHEADAIMPLARALITDMGGSMTFNQHMLQILVPDPAMGHAPAEPLGRPLKGCKIGLAGSDPGWRDHAARLLGDAGAAVTLLDQRSRPDTRLDAILVVDPVPGQAAAAQRGISAKLPDTPVLLACPRHPGSITPWPLIGHRLAGDLLQRLSIEAQDPNASTGSGFRLLIVEDNATNQVLLQSMLANLGCEIALAADGEEAVEQAANGDFHAILMDVHLPVMSGLEATQRIRLMEQAGRILPLSIIGISANTGLDAREQAISVGMDTYLTRPAPTKLLLQSILMGFEASMMARRSGHAAKTAKAQ